MSKTGLQSISLRTENFYPISGADMFYFLIFCLLFFPSEGFSSSPEVHQRKMNQKFEEKTAPAGDLLSLMRESLFERERIKRGLDVYVQKEKELFLNNAQYQKLGDVEVYWENPL